MDSYTIHVEVMSGTLEGAIVAFESHVEQLKQENYRVGLARGGGGSGGGGFNIFVHGPKQPPLSESELRALREILRGEYR